MSISNLTTKLPPRAKIRGIRPDPREKNKQRQLLIGEYLLRRRRLPPGNWVTATGTDVDPVRADRLRETPTWCASRPTTFSTHWLAEKFAKNTHPGTRCASGIRDAHLHQVNKANWRWSEFHPLTRRSADG